LATTEAELHTLQNGRCDSVSN